VREPDERPGKLRGAGAARSTPDDDVSKRDVPAVGGVVQTIAGGDAVRQESVHAAVGHGQEEDRAALRAGAVGYVLKSELASDLLPCLRQADVASPFVSPALAWGS
jgi:hypothetical protein